MNPLSLAINKLQSEELSCVVFDDGGEIFSSAEKGVKPLVGLLASRPDALRGAYVADKVIGKAAASLIAYGGAKACYGQKASQAAVEFLKTQNIPLTYGELLPYIQNRDKTGMCPMEKSVIDCVAADEAYEALMAFIRARV